MVCCYECNTRVSLRLRIQKTLTPRKTYVNVFELCRPKKQGVYAACVGPCATSVASEHGTTRNRRVQRRLCTNSELSSRCLLMAHCVFRGQIASRHRVHARRCCSPFLCLGSMRRRSCRSLHRGPRGTASRGLCRALGFRDEWMKRI